MINVGVRVAMVINSFAQQLEMPTANNGYLLKAHRWAIIYERKN